MSFLKRLLGRNDYEETMLETLVSKGLISLDRAQELLVEVRATGSRAAELIVSSGAVPEGVLMAFLARALKAAPLDVTKFPLRKEIVSLVPAELAVSGRLLAMEKIGSSLTVAMSNPLDEAALEAVTKHTGLKTKVVVTGAAMLLSRLKQAYPEAMGMLDAEPRPAVEHKPVPQTRRAPVRVVAKPAIHPAPPPKPVETKAPEKQPPAAEDVILVFPEAGPPAAEEARKDFPEGEAETAAGEEETVHATAEPVSEEDITEGFDELFAGITGDREDPYAAPVPETLCAVLPGSSPSRRKKK
ncbi:MAG: hypothetical protein JW909_12825 [Planctomycetes bacterium]|nr:hypothetical protein [Planctomycetota bacterium]